MQSMPHGFIFACTNKSERELLNNLIFATNKTYAHKVFAVHVGDFVFFCIIWTQMYS